MDGLLGWVVIWLFVSAIFGALVGQVTERKGQGFALGFWVSLLFSPVIGLLVAIALPADPADRESALSRDGKGVSAAAESWRTIQSSLRPEQYSDFVEAFHGTPEAMLAAKHKRLLQDWAALNKTDGPTVETFLAGDLFPELKLQVRQFIAEAAANSPSNAELNQRLLQQEENEKRVANEAREATDRAEAARRKVEDRAKAARLDQDRRLTDRVMYGCFIVLGALWLLVFLAGSLGTP
jgi:hypothetical protein